VIAEPQTKVATGPIPPPTFVASRPPNNKSSTPPPSPASKTIGASAPALSKFVYHDSKSALPSTTGRLCLMTTECVAVMAEEATPNMMPIEETEVPSRKTPTKKPRVTSPQERRIRREGRECRKMREVQTVKGRTSPRATW